MFYRIRAYLSTAKKQGFSASEAMTKVFEGDGIHFIDGWVKGFRMILV